MRVVICDPGEPARAAEICNELVEMQAIVGGYIEVVPVVRNIVMICNENGKLLEECKPNREVYFKEQFEVIRGSFFFCGVDGEDFTDIPKDYEKSFLALFRNPDFDKNGKKLK